MYNLRSLISGHEADMSKEFDDAIIAMGKKKYDEVKNFISAHPAILGENDSSNNNLLHHAAANGNFSTIHFIMNELEKIKGLDAAVIARNDDGNTPLHLAAATNTAMVIGKLFLQTPDNLKGFALHWENNEGSIPLELLHTNSTDDHSSANYKNVLSLLEDDTLNYPFKSLSEQISATDVYKKFPETVNNKRLQHNIEVMCDAVNETRSVIKGSDTHPDSRFYDTKQYNAISKKINTLRQTKRQLNTGLRTREEEKLILKTGYGNCGEFSTDLAFRVQKLDPSVKVEVFYYAGYTGDHFWVVADRADGSDERDWTTWGPTALIGDAWSGSVYPAYAVPFHLMNFRRYQLKDFDHDGLVPLLTYFNPEHDIIESDTTFTPRAKTNNDITANKETELKQSASIPTPGSLVEFFGLFNKKSSTPTINTPPAATPNNATTPQPTRHVI